MSTYPQRDAEGPGLTRGLTLWSATIVIGDTIGTGVFLLGPGLRVVVLRDIEGFSQQETAEALP